MRVAGLSNHVEGAGWAFFVDMDVAQQDLSVKPQEFRECVQAALKDFRLPFAWLFETGRGYHLVAPFAASSMKAVRAFHRRFDAWGADDAHRVASLHYGRLILRCTAKDGEPDGIKYLATYRVKVDNPRPALSPIMEFYAERYHLFEAVSSFVVGDGMVTVEAYDAAPKAVPAA